MSTSRACECPGVMGARLGDHAMVYMEVARAHLGHVVSQRDCDAGERDLRCTPPHSRSGRPANNRPHPPSPRVTFK